MKYIIVLVANKLLMIVEPFFFLVNCTFLPLMAEL